LYLCIQAGFGAQNGLHQAATCFTRAAELGCVPAVTLYGRCLEWREGLLMDYHEAVRYFRMAAEKHDTTGLSALRLCFAWGRGREQ
jgi:TPR repeat protein